MKSIVFLLFIVSASFSFSQNEWWKTESESEETTPERVTIPTNRVENLDNVEPGKVNVVKSSSIEKLIKFKSTAIPPHKTPLKDGFRIQLFFDQNRTEVDNARRSILSDDSSAETYIQYKAPNYILLLGNYREELDAERERARRLSEFPEAIIVKDKIEFPKIEPREVEED